MGSLHALISTFFFCALNWFSKAVCPKEPLPLKTRAPTHTRRHPLCRIHHCHQGGVLCHGVGTKGRLERCDIWSNMEAPGVEVKKGGDLTLIGCIIRDHRTSRFVEGSGVGLFVRANAGGVTVGADCVFARNAWGDVVREPSQRLGSAATPPGELLEATLTGALAAGLTALAGLVAALLAFLWGAWKKL